MKCRYCHKNVRSIAHFSTVHGKLLRRKAAATRRKGRRSRGHGGGGGHRGRDVACTCDVCPKCGGVR